MKILFTGMSSGHTNESVHYSKLGFFGVVSKVISENMPQHSVEWREPSVSWTKADLEKYDRIFIGVIPPTGLSANKVYGALHLMNIMSGDGRVSLVLDNPQLWQYKTSFASIARDPKSLVTKFYERRSEYKLVKEDAALLKSFSDLSGRMASGNWQQTIYPSLPWKSDADVVVAAGISSHTPLTGLNLDSHLLTDGHRSPEMKDGNWVVDNPTTSWSKSMISTLTRSVDSMKQSTKEVDVDVFERLKSSVGSMISPQDRGVGTWWTHRYIQALNAGSPIITDWRETIQMSAVWGLLGYQVEEMSEPKRNELAIAQKEAYLAFIPDKHSSIQKLDRILNNKEEVKNA
jgi:hypothetical protein